MTLMEILEQAKSLSMAERHRLVMLLSESIHNLDVSPNQTYLASQGCGADFFDHLDAIKADDLIDRPEQGFLEVREAIE